MTHQPLPPYSRVALIFIITFIIYLPSLYSVFFSQEIISLDDNSLLSHLSNQGINLRETLRPGWQGKYYRPVIDFSFFVEQYLWGGQPFGYRLTNVLIHTFNATLLYLFSRQLLKAESYRNEISIFAALLFALHPVTVESVAWISGRTDPLATFWSLLGLIFYLAWKQKGKCHLIFLSFLFIALAILAKEVAIATPAAIVVLELFYLPSFSYKKNRSAKTAIILFLISITAYLLLRAIVIKGEDLGLGFVVDRLMKGDILFSFKIFIASIGFYFKKFLLPLPLSFTIHSINLTFYFISGLALITAIIVLIFKKTGREYCFLLIWAMGGIIPAALISFADVAWTPWAERYLYYSVVPLSITTSMAITRIYKKSYSKKYMPVLYILPLFMFGAMTINRSFVFSHNDLLWEDSYRKAPNFMGAATAYASILLHNGKIDEAEKIFKNSMSISAPKHHLYLNLGDISYKRGNYDKMKSYYLMALEEARNDKRLVTMGMTFRRDILTNLAVRTLGKAREEENEALLNEAIDYFLQAYKEHANIFIYYQISKIYIEKGDKIKAAEYLKKFIKHRGTEGYLVPAKALLKNIERELKE